MGERVTDGFGFLAALVSAVAALVLLGGCTDAETAQFIAFGRAGEIVCYSGGREIYRGRSSGKIHSEDKSDGWYLMDAATRRLVRVSGDCVVTDLAEGSP
jgi:hypothetical protein